MKVIILRGVSGAGKTEGALRQSYCGGIYNEGFFVVSADNYFLQMDDANRVSYNFDPKKLPEAHNHCLRQFLKGLERLKDYHIHTIVVDNTNTTVAEVAPYIALARAFEADLEVHTILVDPFVAAKRNTHGVPLSSVIQQDLRLRRSIEEWPPFWPTQIFHNSDEE